MFLSEPNVQRAPPVPPDQELVAVLKERYRCPHFRILVIGQANAGKTTILEKVCGVARGTEPVIFDKNGLSLRHGTAGPEPVIFDNNGVNLRAPKHKFSVISRFFKRLFRMKPLVTHLKPSMERGIHDIEHQITYYGSNFIFHDSRGFESGVTEEMDKVWEFIEQRASADELKDQLHAIWYCIPMDGSRPLPPREFSFFQKGTGKGESYPNYLFP